MFITQSNIKHKKWVNDGISHTINALTTLSYRRTFSSRFERIELCKRVRLFIYLFISIFYSIKRIELNYRALLRTLVLAHLCQLQKNPVFFLIRKTFTLFVCFNCFLTFVTIKTQHGS